MSNVELQQEEREVLLSIYEGDSCFKDLSPTIYQYRYGEDNDPRSFLLEIAWTEDYPSKKPKINMDTFYNDHIETSFKEKIANVILDKAEQYLGEAMTYSLFEYVKEIEEELTKVLTVNLTTKSDISCSPNETLILKEQDASKKPAPKKVHLTKAQKKREWDKVNSRGEKPRGWDWVDLIKHLSQTAHKSTSQQQLPNE